MAQGCNNTGKAVTLQCHSWTFKLILPPLYPKAISFSYMHAVVQYSAVHTAAAHVYYVCM